MHVYVCDRERETLTQDSVHGQGAVVHHTLSLVGTQRERESESCVCVSTSFSVHGIPGTSLGVLFTRAGIKRDPPVVEERGQHGTGTCRHAGDAGPPRIAQHALRWAVSRCVFISTGDGKAGQAGRKEDLKNRNGNFVILLLIHSTAVDALYAAMT